ncbi:hypothetical protein X801_09090 [Opisthorchis viverrini]|uniref:Uncharacterized protein n=1 Tax=Opisthorchis viverrini TaxID=6198 RepID=A0A1S8WKZ5_OPIVI|nr:hypothetical protein X801_09090 [Opisthorchis viverrini]
MQEPQYPWIRFNFRGSVFANTGVTWKFRSVTPLKRHYSPEAHLGQKANRETDEVWSTHYLVTTLQR